MVSGGGAQCDRPVLTGIGDCGSGQVSLSAATGGIVKIFTLAPHTFRYICSTFYEFIEM